LVTERCADLPSGICAFCSQGGELNARCGLNALGEVLDSKGIGQKPDRAFVPHGEYRLEGTIQHGMESNAISADRNNTICLCKVRLIILIR
jgi:hypothetical protein